jgi:hypothetical protein
MANGPNTAPAPYSVAYRNDLLEISLGAPTSQNPKRTVAHVIHSSSCKNGEEPARFQREKDKVERGSGAVEMIKGG